MTVPKDEQREGERLHQREQNRSWGWVLAFIVALVVVACVFAYSVSGERARTVERNDSTTGQAMPPPAQRTPPATR